MSIKTPIKAHIHTNVLATALTGATPEQLNKLKNELQRLKIIGGLDKIVGSEGLTFYYNDKIYKLTGLFAPVNQILGLLKYQR